jgi:hypothetical protein
VKTKSRLRKKYENYSVDYRHYLYRRLTDPDRGI